MLLTEDKSEPTLQLYSTICRLNFYRDLDASRHSVNRELDELPRSKSQMFQDVPLSFADPQAYQSLWRPLFVQELKGYVSTARMSESSEPEECEAVGVYQLGSFRVIQLKKLRKGPVEYQTGFLMLLSPQKLLPQDREQKHPHLVGIVYRCDSLLHVRILLDEANTEKSDWDILTTSKNWFIQSLCSLTSLERQYHALSSFSKLHPSLQQILLRPHQNRLNSAKNFNIPVQLEQRLKSMFNESQLEAIHSSLRQEGVTLIQGPPGTGKTKTLLGTLSVLLQSSINKQEDEELPLLQRWKTSQQKMQTTALDRNPWFKEDYTDWRDEPMISHPHQLLALTTFYPKAVRTVTLMSRKQESSAPGRVLVCGPSNASVDEVIRKMIKEQLLDEQGRNYLPRFVRVGENYHQSLQEYSLDHLTAQVQTRQAVDAFEARKKLLRESRIVFATLSSAGSNALANTELQFDTVVIDEAGQAVQVSSLIPLLYGCRRVILIGDPNQLPATVFSSVCIQHHYDMSLFQRLMKAQYPLSMLKMQYRMHPSISRVIAGAFYQGLLEDAPKIVDDEPKGVPRPFMMLHIEQSNQEFHQQSYRNPVEGECVRMIAGWLAKRYDEIGILSPYSQQVKWLAKKEMAKCQVRTIDSFQGRQKQVIIFSPVRARPKESKDDRYRRTIGFVGDGRRLNVALSRAREVCIVVGDLHRLQVNKTWRHMIADARKRGEAFKVQNAGELRKVGENWHKLRSF